MWQFNRTYFLLTVLLFATEVCIALFVHDNFVRPYLGDVLVVILIYCFVKSFLKVAVTKACIGVLLFAFGVEIMQYFLIVEKLNLQDNRLARTVIGTSFAWEDILAYIAGIVIVIVSEKFFSKKQTLQ
ncbi:DUF2809 domain-containing protein [Flavobacterium sp. IMCC34852]|uniref:DUF2809 domain-containing protein n=1 Tax=Flavobacterium rivulicola TaxID=2732161 RepID=A0A7Y3RAW9_9FLAO|nr:DUF2809 domain-containing protein [Flavobacterium sp. IMCC34852]NNT73130.1 DUF2809 domain-containing protein [Flavobacterium sp. IMCC34852]